MIARGDIDAVSPDLSARGARRVETVPDAVMDEVLAKIVAIFE